MRFLPRNELELFEKKNEPQPFFRIAGSTSCATRNGPRAETWSPVSRISTGTEQFLVGRKVAAFEIAGVVDQHLGIAGLASDRRKGAPDRILRDEIQFDNQAIAALLADRGRQRHGIVLTARGEDGEEVFLREFLGDRAAHTPAHADFHVAVIDGMAVRQQRIAAVGLPLGSGADNDAHLFAFCIGFH